MIQLLMLLKMLPASLGDSTVRMTTRAVRPAAGKNTGFRIGAGSLCAELFGESTIIYVCNLTRTLDNAKSARFG